MTWNPVVHTRRYFTRIASKCCQKLAKHCAVLSVATAVLGGTGCTTSFREYIDNGFKVGPNYCRPAVPIADEWIDYQDAKLIQDRATQTAWWRVFNDPILDELILTAYQQNLTLREAGYRVLEARALRGIAVGNLFPQSQSLTGGYTRTRFSQNGNQFGGGGTGGGAIGGLGGNSFGIWSLGGQLAWELDFWGRFRRAIEAADAELDASIEDYDNVLVILISDVAQAYIEIRTAEQRLEYARRNVNSQAGSLGLAEERLEAGATSRLDVSQARTNVAQTESLVPQLEIQLRQAQNRLCVLMGIPPQRMDGILDGRKGIPVPPMEVIVGVPADLIRRRPDVRRAERLLAAQSARIGIAEADLYPAFSISGNLQVQASEFDELFQSSSLAGNVGPSFNWNVLNYGRIRNNILVQEARFQQLVAQYQNTVLTANREAEDAIIGFLRSQVRTRVLAEGAAAAEDSRDLVQILYRGGSADFGRVFVAESALVQQQDELAIARGEIAQFLVDVHRSLGGGWQIRLVAPPPTGNLVQTLPPVQQQDAAPQPPAEPVPTPAPQPDLSDEAPVPPGQTE